MSRETRRASHSLAAAQAGFTLIEMVGVLAIIMILVTVVFSTTIRQANLVAGAQEGTNLVIYASALQRSIVRNGYIPGAADWASNVAVELGLHPGTVSTNPCSWPRVLVIDPALLIGTNGFGLPFRQTYRGSVVTNASGDVIAPANVRLLLLSSLGPPLPSGATNGGFTAATFSNTWNTADGAVPSGSPWTGWGGTGDDLRMQRLNLSPLFLHLLLGNYPTNTQGRYAIDRLATNLVPADGVDAYFIQSTPFQLFKSTGALDSEQILSCDTSLIYAMGAWQGSIFQSPTNVIPGRLSGAVFAQAATTFAASPGNALAIGGATPATVVNAVNAFMSNYVAWAAAGFPATGTLNSGAKTSESLMQTEMQKLANGFSPGRCN